ncbi:dockerin type I repeat-containing protein [Clostridium sp. A1-XYC3]|uniref:Dockerin type I repeat-containing protein n=1 Tax=Clostridium tanneri TaxID=3037988 RepID=A0ABU4JY05_9CLOT|nr:dockerin type I repeat-containing protein [Clostridium sp. A1-XYC3]MDW8803040.1 dockerin type I repeat-containing protein [Clostridium sp. A1-XYC3]
MLKTIRDINESYPFLKKIRVKETLTGLAVALFITMLNYNCVLAVAPADQNFDSIPIQESPIQDNPFLNLNGVIYSTDSTHDALRVDTISNITGNLPTLGIGNGLSSNWYGTNTGTYFQFASANNTNNFKVLSLRAEVWGGGSGTAEKYIISGYDNGVQKVSATVNFTASGTYGLGNASIIYNRQTTPAEEVSSGNMANAGLLTFGSDWNNIDQVRFTVADNKILAVFIDQIDFSNPIITTQLQQVTNVQLSPLGIASWDDIYNESGYELQLYKDGVPQGNVVLKNANTTTHSFISDMRAAGVGNYTVKVVAKGDRISYLDSVQSAPSPSQTVVQLGTVSTGLLWTGNIAHWDAVTNALSYDVQLYKEGVEQGSPLNVLAANIANGQDFTDTILSLGNGAYTYKVTAKGNDTLILDGMQSGVSDNNIKLLEITTISVTAGRGLGRADKKLEFANVKIPFFIDSQSFLKDLTSYSFDILYDPTKVGTVTVDTSSGMTKPTIGAPVIDGSKERVTLTWSGTFTEDLVSIYNANKGVLFKLNFVTKPDFVADGTNIEVGTGSFNFGTGVSSSNIVRVNGKIMFGIYGDIDGDGKITSADSNLVNKYTTGRKSFITGEVKETAADVNADGHITSADATEILNYISGKLSTLKTLFGY